MYCPECGAENDDRCKFCQKCGTRFDEYTPVSATDETVKYRYPRAGSSVTLIGRTVAGCLIEEELGRGGMGVVYLGTHVQLQQKRAIKILPPDFAGNAVYLERFFKEARTVASMKHPNIVQVHDAGEQDGHFYFVMEYVEGTNLSAEIRKKQRYHWKETVPVIRQVLLAFQAAHARGVIHRDIKPDNILLDKSGNAMVADFGLVKNLGEESGNLTGTGQVMGTPYYMSPEQCMGKPADQRTDIYSLGATVYTMLTGGTMFRAETPLAMLRMQIDVEPNPISELVPDVPLPLVKYVHKMLAKDPDERFGDAGDALKALSGLADEVSGGEIFKAAPPISEVSTIKHPTPVQSTERNGTKKPRPESSYLEKSSAAVFPVKTVIIALTAIVLASLGVVAFFLVKATQVPEEVTSMLLEKDRKIVEGLDKSLEAIYQAKERLNLEIAQQLLKSMEFSNSYTKDKRAKEKVEEARKLVAEIERTKSEFDSLLKGAAQESDPENKLRLMEKARELISLNEGLDIKIKQLKEQLGLREEEK